jgi:hypothetical protein
MNQAGLRARLTHDAPAFAAATTHSPDTGIARAIGAAPLATRATEIPVAAAPVGTLIWRVADTSAPHRQQAAPSRDAGNRGALMRTADNDRQDAGSAAVPGAPGSVRSPVQAGIATGAVSPPPSADPSRLAEEVMRLLARRIHIERERRGGKIWR